MRTGLLHSLLLSSETQDTLLPAWCCTSRQLIPCLVCWSSGSIWMCVIFIELTSRYECGLSDKTKGPWTVDVNQFMLLGSVYVRAPLEKRPALQSSAIIQSGWIKKVERKEKKQISSFTSSESSVKHTMQMVACFFLWPFSDCVVAGTRLCMWTQSRCSKKLSAGGSNWFWENK